MPHKLSNPIELLNQDSSQPMEPDVLVVKKPFPSLPLKVVKDNDGNPIGITEATDGLEDEADLQRWKESMNTQLTRMREREDFFIKVLEHHERGESDVVLALLRTRSDLPEFLLFILDYMNDPKSRAKAGGHAKYASLMSYTELAKREYFEEKKSAKKLTQMAFAIDFVTKMTADYETAKNELSELNVEADAIKNALSAMDFKTRKNSNESEELKSIKEQIRVLKRHPKPVSEDTVVTWLTEKELNKFIPSAEQTSRP